MDQNAFRNLLSSQAVKPGTGRSAGVLGTHAAKRGAGKSKNSTYKLTKEDKKKDEEDAGSALDLAPRKAAKKGKGRENPDGYQDRSESRRAGKDDDSNEFKAAEKLAEDFEKRAREEGQDEDAIAEQRKYLGGDATHSILVKGLDFALLAARKAEIEATEGRKAEDELDAFIESEQPDRVPDADPFSKANSGKKRTREEIVQELKRQRTGAAPSEVPVQETLGSKFKSIAQKKREAEEAQAQVQGKKKLKKKKKVVAPSAPVAPADSAKTVPSLPMSPSGQPAIQKEPEAEPLIEPPQPSGPKNAPIPGVTPVPDDEDDDIFGGVGEYVGAIDSDSESEPEIEHKPSPKQERARSRSRSEEDRRHERFDEGRLDERRREDSRRDDRSRSPHRYERSRSRERYDNRDRYGNYSRDSSRRSRSREYDRDYHRGYRERPRYDERYERSRADRYSRRSRSRSRERFYREERDYRREYRESRSPSPYHSRNRSPASRVGRSSEIREAQPMRPLSRSPTPVNIDALRALSQSPEFSDEEDAYAGPIRPGQSLRALGFGSSDVLSARELLEADALANKAAERRANKAKWRKAQGLAAQEGAGDDDEDGGDKNRRGQELTEQQKLRRDQQRLQAYMEKKEKAAKK
ncbi:hypothetical protein NliqN6_0265 [Naganishia liquefaciens]|uniref:RED-like N-terminal domain-containing protein n=1 Tax=Naganishia liquefaciens TaxID=104408 RepID=A0A8H3TMQ2_9TREE|nr:hypothetical protein NliqN6_0265 [Naganishia liquefaciens]